ncbi:TPA: quorum threshold expression element, QteE [Pseudomonas aeruginosa]|nr:quorum threshold expression element, QteE [Pseudomonas aeruginosa]
MLIHICPTLELPSGFNLPCRLLEVQVEEFDLVLKGNVDVVPGRPFRNSRALVARRKLGRQPVNGILLDVPGFAPFFTAVTRWSIAGEVLLTHRVEYVVLDDVFDAVSDFPSLWLQLDSTEGQWSDRTPEFVRSPYPARLETPAMKFDYPLDLLERVRGRGLGMQNTKIFRLPTIEPGRLMGRGRAIQRRLPAPETAIKIDRERVNYMR